MVTRTTPCLANGAPAAPCNAPEPPTNPPPWIHTITGSLRAVGSAGRQTFRNRQSSEGAGGAGAPAGGGGPNRPCMQLAPYSAAWRTPVHRAAGWGGRHRRSPTGGAAKGMPLKETTPSSTTPCNSPPSTRTTAWRLRPRIGANTRRDRQRGQRACEKSGHPRNRRGSVVPFCAHISPPPHRTSRVDSPLAQASSRIGAETRYSRRAIGKTLEARLIESHIVRRAWRGDIHATQTIRVTHAPADSVVEYRMRDGQSWFALDRAAGQFCRGWDGGDESRCLRRHSSTTGGTAAVDRGPDAARRSRLRLLPGP